MSGSARVGIVVRTKNRPWFLRRALTDIAAQRYRSWNVCIVNDGGDRRTVEDIVSDLSAELRPFVNVLHNSESAGRSAAANQGIRALDTEFVVLHDDDDLWHPEFLEKTVEWITRHPDEVGVVTRTEIVFEKPTPDGGFVGVEREVFWADLDEIRFTDVLEVNRWVPISYLYRRELHDRIGYYDEHVHAAEDWDFGLRTLVRHRVGFLDGSPLAYWMQRRGIEGDMGNSMFALAHDHERFDRQIRDAALRDYAAAHGSGLPLYIAGLVKEESGLLLERLRRIVREEVSKALDARPSDLERVRRRLFRRYRERTLRK
ncbi:glycosyltransferase involved in cell wall biosynthesis [Microbacterium laevaniformans]|uniref:glycosyltransferase family 2 protein n=1 Tax=Microbacterium laevaniformans TaxID=36807 RepID=UPI00195AA778|nr:glycosyltransferase family A protein [Microbacterium laevaniformans]MBM7751793.1 glycosyltransferase involved in cell wall biosynthesis [Microbacterium laevaniformans]GLJ63852.1 hypothetical protein GCM10017578_07400 [Microbacterium laevaniformans]